MSSYILADEELRAITGYALAKKQLDALHRAGFYRARLSPAGTVILERAHYEAVCAGNNQPNRPTVKPPRDRRRPHAQKLAAQGF